MPGVGGRAQPGKNRFDALSGYRETKSYSKSRKAAPGSVAKVGKTKPRKPQAGSVSIRQPKFK
jgi:hypothetical protein